VLELRLSARLGRVFSLELAPGQDIWRLAGPGVPDRHTVLYRRCANLDTEAACNWLVEIDPKALNLPRYCASCRLTRTIPDLSVRENAVLWGRLEIAKRRVISDRSKARGLDS
jgi:hypothetical protein